MTACLAEIAMRSLSPGARRKALIELVKMINEEAAAAGFSSVRRNRARAEQRKNTQQAQ